MKKVCLYKKRIKKQIHYFGAGFVRLRERITECGTIKNEVTMLEKGLKHISRTVVQPDNFALTMGSGDLPVLATPALVALMENAAMLAVAAELPEGATTVGAKMDMTHVRPSGEGEEVHAEATLVEVEGRKLTFSLVARDSADVIGEGTHIRYIVDRAKFLLKLKG